MGLPENYSLGLGGANSRATTVSAKPQTLCEPSQKGLFADWPQRQRLKVVRPASPKGRPSGSTNSKSPSMRMEPLWFTVILVAANFCLLRISSHHTASGAHAGAHKTHPEIGFT